MTNDLISLHLFFGVVGFFSFVFNVFVIKKEIKWMWFFASLSSYVLFLCWCHLLMWPVDVTSHYFTWLFLRPWFHSRTKTVDWFSSANMSLYYKQPSAYFGPCSINFICFSWWKRNNETHTNHRGVFHKHCWSWGRILSITRTIWWLFGTVRDIWRKVEGERWRWAPWEMTFI